MPVSIELEEIQAQLPELALRLHNGSEVLITKGGQPYIKLVAHAVMPAGPRNLDQLKGAFYISDAAIDELFLSPPAPAGAAKPPLEGKVA